MEAVKTFKLTTVGDSGVGKTSIIQYALRGRLDPNTSPTIAAAFTIYKYPPGGCPKCVYHIWDSAGSERFFSLVQLYIRGSHVVFLVYDCSKPETLESLEKRWIPYVNANTGDSVEKPLKVVIENKIDLLGAQVDSAAAEITERGRQLALSNGMMFFRVSSVSGEGIHEMFAEVSSVIMNMKFEHLLMPSQTPQSIVLTRKSTTGYRCFGLQSSCT
jgi:small GTP-binding protein